MTSLSRTYTDKATNDTASELRARRGGPRGRGPAPATADARFNSSMIHATLGSHMPIDTEIHWDWSNPLNIIPAALLLLFVIALIAAIV